MMESRFLRGFTLVETLVVLMVLFILFMLFFLVYGNVYDKVGNLQCKNNIRMIAQAALSYTADNGGQLPDRMAWRSPKEANKKVSLLPYLGVPLGGVPEAYDQDSVFTCPVAQKLHPTKAELRPSYAINQYSAGSSITEEHSWITTVLNKDAPLEISKVNSVNTQAFFLDSPSVADPDSWRYSVYQRPDRLKSEGTGWKTKFIHENSINVVFMDGHVERISLAYAEKELAGSVNLEDSPRMHSFWGAGK